MPASLRYLAIIVLVVGGLGCAPSPQEPQAQPPQAVEVTEQSLLARYHDKTEIPAGLLKAYTAFVASAKVATEANLKPHCLLNSVSVSVGGRPEHERYIGQDLNVPFLRSPEWYPEILEVRTEPDDCYLVSTGSSAVWFVQTRSGSWKIYRYVDRPIQ